ncbi:hypothetical protein [Thermosulfurimonas sp. F29]|uniref:hypothetical protein n=1 Tax=Thermosulfurimonas sp. F29 TaxID=2867247 RepID=UPI001C828832|nr:hypothetical protein [Thermosulfurimonas sp. F29]MBX6424219.1 hypothetical protein [Thermosulfurimonas sp. F29]
MSQSGAPRSPGATKAEAIEVRRGFRAHGRINYPTVLPILDIPFEDAIILLGAGIILSVIFSLMVLVQALTGLPLAPAGVAIFLAGIVRIVIEVLRVRRRFTHRAHRPVLRNLTESFAPDYLWRQSFDAERVLFAAFPTTNRTSQDG